MKIDYREHKITQTTLKSGNHVYKLGKNKKVYESIHLLDIALDRIGAKK